MEKGKASTRAKNKYNASNYDSIRVVVPKGKKAVIEAKAKEAGVSINSVVNEALRAFVGMSEEEWKQKEN